ncbi:MAG: aspartate aminotransferase family protein [Desulfurococcaceae archaeon]
MSTLDAVLEKWISRLELEYMSRTPRSRELYERAKKRFPAGVTYALRYYHPYPVYIERAKGTRVWDVDGNEYIDFWMGHGVHLLGHLPDVVTSAVEEVLSVGTHFGFEHPYVLEYVEYLMKIVPKLEFIRFTNSGTEANMYAIRLARAHTKRKYVVKMEGGWHGVYDALHVAVNYPYTEPESAGLLEESYKYTVAVPFNDLDALEKAMRKYEPAAVVLEPVMGAAGCIEPTKGYLRGVREIADAYGALLVFDEVVTGFRLSPGGAQEYYGVRADIVVYGKALSGGVGSIGAIGGREDVMNLVDHIKHPRLPDRVHHAGTYTANLIAVAAGYAMIKHLAEHRSIYESANGRWFSFREAVNKLCSEVGIECWATGDGSLSAIHFTRKKPLNAREAQEYRWSRAIERALHIYSRVKGVLYMTEKTPHFLPALTQSPSEIEYLLGVLRDFLEEASRLLPK